MEPELFRLHAAIEEEHWWFVGRRQIMRTLLADILPPHANRQVVDVGCGTGANIASLADAYDVLGIDTTPEAIRLSQDRFPGVTFVCGRAPQDLGERASHVDAFLLSERSSRSPSSAAGVSTSSCWRASRQGAATLAGATPRTCS